MRAPAKRLGGVNPSRGFESHSLRHDNQMSTLTIPLSEVNSVSQNSLDQIRGSTASYHVWTIGCQMNVADSERLESALDQMGLSKTTDLADADVVVLNSCVVRQSAEDKVTSMLGHMKPLKHENKNKIVALMGCLVGPNTKNLKQQFPQVDVFMQPQQYQPLLDIVGDRLDIDPSGCVGPLTATPAITAYIPIIHGCNKMCSFCIIPYRRGREVSRSITDIARETELLADRGVKEITLLGQNVDSYGQDLTADVDLGDLLEAVHEIDSIERIRFLTSHPNDMSDHIIETVAELPKVCENINLPFQAGDNDVLTRMRRGYTNREYRDKIEKIREKIPGVSVTTDLIVGFCGETDKQFEQTYNLVKDIRFDKVHSAMYSTRPGTIASKKMEDDVPAETKRERLHAIDDLQTDIQGEINKRYHDETVEVLIEDIKRGTAYGRNRNDKLVYVDDATHSIGQSVNVTIHRTGPWSLGGVLKPFTGEDGGSNGHS